MRREVVRLTLLLTVMVVVAGCTTPAAPAPTPTTVARQPLRISWDVWPGYFPLVIAKEKGFFAKHNVEVEPVLIKDGSLGANKLIAGELEGMLNTLTGALQLDSTAPDATRVVMTVDYSDGADAIVADPSIKSPADLRGKRIGAMMGKFSELLVLNMLEQNGLSSQDVTFVQTDSISVPLALENKSIVAGHTWEPELSQAIQQGNHIIFSSANTPGLISDVLILRTEVTQQRPDDVRAFILAWFEAVDYWKAHPDECRAIIAKAADIEPATISTDGLKLLSLDDNKQAFTASDATVSLYTSAKQHIEFLIRTGRLTTPPNAQRLIDKTFLP